MAMAPEDIYPVRWTGRQALVALPEDIDVSNAGPIREELLSVINRGAEALIVDMTATISCDHAGADAVARAYQRAVVSRTELRLVVTSGVVLRMLGMTGVGRLVPVYPSVEAALAARSGASPAASAVLTPADRDPGHAAKVTGRQRPDRRRRGGRAAGPRRRDCLGQPGVAGLRRGQRGRSGPHRHRRVVPEGLCRRRGRPGGGRSRRRHPRRAGGRPARPADGGGALSQPVHRTLVRRADLISLR